MKSILVLLLLIIPAALYPASGSDDFQTFLPPSDAVEGLKLSGEVRTYPGRKIFDFINGAGEIFLDYNFISAASAEYYREDPDMPIVVELYMMKTPEDAYGIYAYYKPKKPRYLDVGTGGHFDGLRLDFWKDVYYAKVYALDSGPTSEGDVRSLARHVEKSIKARAPLPELVRLFLKPEIDASADSLRFFRVKRSFDNLKTSFEKNILGLSEKTEGALADVYLDEERKTSACFFIVEYPDEKSARSAHEILQDAINTSDEAKDIAAKIHGRYLIGTLDAKVPLAQSKIEQLTQALKVLSESPH